MPWFQLQWHLDLCYEIIIMIGNIGTTWQELWNYDFGRYVTLNSSKDDGIFTVASLNLTDQDSIERMSTSNSVIPRFKGICFPWEFLLKVFSIWSKVCQSIWPLCKSFSD